MRYLILTAVAFFMLSVTTVDAQFNVGKLKNKVQDKVENTTSDDSSEEKPTEKKVEKTESSSTGSKSKKAEDDPFKLKKDYGMTDDIHAKHLKEIVFSRTPVEFQKGTEEQLTKTFTLGDDIYFMAYFENSFKNQWLKEKVDVPTNSVVYVYIWWEVNGKEVGVNQPNSFEIQHGNTYPDMVEKWTGLSYPQYSLAVCESHKVDNPQIGFHSYVIPVLKQGDNKVKMFVSFEVYQEMESGKTYSNFKKESKVIYKPAQPMATGEMTIKVNNIADVKKTLLNSGFIVKAVQSNPALEKQIITVYNTNNKEDQAVKALIMYDDWSIRRDDLGNIISRYMEVKVIVTTKDPDSYMVWTKEVANNYTGGGNYSTKIVLSNIVEDPYTVPAILFK